MESDRGIFYREFELEIVNNTNELDSVTLRIAQNEVSDVGGVVWDGALLACKYFEKMAKINPKQLIGKKILELGAGTGICSLTACCLGADVCATDLPDVVPLLAKNYDINKHLLKGVFSVEPISWGNQEHIGRMSGCVFDWILIIDCLYYEMSTKPLLDTLMALVTRGRTKVLCVYEEREIGKPKHAVEEFFKLAKEHFQICEVPDEELHPDYRASEIKSLILTLID